MSNRIVERLTNGQYVQVEWCDLKKGDVFKSFESDGDPILDNNDNTVFTASKDAYHDGICWVVEIEEDTYDH